MFKKILIANRGEIACRIIRTAREMNIATTAVYSNADRNALHIHSADEAFSIGASPALDSYLQCDKLLRVAKDCGAEAIHPGYGFLSENPEFAEQCHDANLVFIGPPADVIRRMGIKSLAKDIMHTAGIPIIPGYSPKTPEEKLLLHEAEALGFPLLIKADRGGGGKGIRIVQSLKEFTSELHAVQREAGSSFGNSEVILEKYLTHARHIEVQIFRDTHGHSVHLFERDCSLQRRHQKIIEEAPAVGLSKVLRKKLYAAALKAANIIGYIGAGTVEFLIDGQDNFYFMEINTRLQVEHPVTEMITGKDLVAWQLLVAAGHPLPCGQDDITHKGYGIEARIYAENPENNFLPSTGEILHLQLPKQGKTCRVDSGIVAGDQITPHYDPLLAKLIVRADSRKEAFTLLHTSLQQFHIAGISTNIGFLSNLVSSSSLFKDQNTAGFIENNLSSLITSPHLTDSALVLACLHQLRERTIKSRRKAATSADPHSPWQTTSGFRLNATGVTEITFEMNKGVTSIPIQMTADDTVIIHLPEESLIITEILWDNNDVLAHTNGKRIRGTVIAGNNTLTVFHGGMTFHVPLKTHDLSTIYGNTLDKSLHSPMPGQIIAVHIPPGSEVKKGDAIITLEAMKMEYTISAPTKGVVTDILFQKGDTVDEGERLLVFKQTQEITKG